MTLTDILLIAALAVFVVAWWVRRTPARRWVLIGAAVAALIIAIAGYLDDRWQDLTGAIVALIYLAALGGVVLKNRITRTDITGGIPYVTGVLVTIAAAGVIAALMMFPVWPLPKPTGQYAVGVRSFEIVDTARIDSFAPQPNTPRRLLVRVWYPAQGVSGDPAPYFTAAETKSTSRSIGSLLGMPFFFSYVRHVKTNSYTDAPLLSGAANLPVVIYSHGYTSYLNQNTALMEELASHGYVAFSVQHTYDSADTAFPNGDIAPMDPNLLKTMANEANRPSQADSIGGDTLDKRINAAILYQEFAVKNGDRIAIQSTKTWMADRIFLHDTLQKSPPASIADIVRASNLDKVGELGMSFGGAIAGELCLFDKRCAVGVNMDGGNFPFSSFNADEPVPFLMFHSDTGLLYQSLERALPANGIPRDFNEFSYERIATTGARPDVYRILLKDTAHLGLSDSSLFVEQPIRGLFFGNAPSKVMIGAQNDFIRGFLDKHLRGQPSDYPAKQLADYKGQVVALDVSDVAPWWNAKTDEQRAAIEARINAVKPKYEAAPAN